MALADTSNAIGAVTRFIADHLNRRTSLPISTGRPEQASGNAATINIFLYEVEVDASMRNIPLNEDDPAPLWLNLKYLMTGFGTSGESDDADGHDTLGQGMGALQEIAILRLDQSAAASVRAALESNPEPLKLTFEKTPPSLMSISKREVLKVFRPFI